MRNSYIYRKLASVRTSIFLLFILLFFFLMGTIFPQGVSYREYEEAKGGFLFAAKYLGFLNIFETPGFLIAAALLSLNILVCTFERARSLLRGRGRRGKFSFKTGSGWLSPLSIIFHGGIFICLIAFFTTHIYSYENQIVLTKGEESEVILPGGEQAPFKLRLERFDTLYEQNPRLNLPKQKGERIRSILSGGKKGVTYEVGSEDLAVSDWISRITVISGEKAVAEKNVEVNGPLRFGGITFYQMGFDQNVKLSVQDKEMEITPRKPFEVEGYGTFSISYVKHGLLTRLDGSKMEIDPFFYLYRMHKEKKGGKKREKIGSVTMGEKTDFGGKEVRFLSFSEKSVLSYRIDPSVTVLYYTSFLVIGLICIQLYRDIFFR